MKFREYIKEEIKSKLVKTPFGKQRIITGYKDYNRLYVLKRKPAGQKAAYIVTTDVKADLDNMVEIDGEYWFSTLKELHKRLNK